MGQLTSLSMEMFVLTPGGDEIKASAGCSFTQQRLWFCVRACVDAGTDLGPLPSGLAV